jgi:hypothetical protein
LRYPTTKKAAAGNRGPAGWGKIERARKKLADLVNAEQESDESYGMFVFFY